MASWKRPYGVGLLIAGSDRDGPHLYETTPSGEFFEFRATAIGSRSQSARTYLEDHVDSFADSTVDELITHALKALQGPANDKPLTIENVSVAVVGANRPFALVDSTKIQTVLDIITPEVTEEAAQDEIAGEDEEDDEDQMED